MAISLSRTGPRSMACEYPRKPAAGRCAFYVEALHGIIPGEGGMTGWGDYS
jgi:hypothetical protein